MTRSPLLGAALAGVVALSGCGGSLGGDDSAGSKTVTVQKTITVKDGSTTASSSTTAPATGSGLNPERVYKEASPGVVTVISLFNGGLGGLLGGDQGGEGVGSGFVISKNGEIATNAHVVTNGQGSSLKRAKSVYVQFGNGNQVPGKIVGTDAYVDVALIKIDPSGLEMKPLPLGQSNGLTVGQPVAAIGSPFNEPQSLSIGVISALDRTIDSLAGRFGISGAIQTDAAINHGNSGGPLLDKDGRVLGINSQIQSTGGGGEGVGFAVPVDAVRRSLDQLRSNGKATYAYLGVTSVALFPQLAKRFDLPVEHGAWIQEATAGGPAGKAGLKGGGAEVEFQAARFKPGGDIITKVDGKPIRRQEDLSELVSARKPGETVKLEVYSGSKQKTVEVKLDARPGTAG
jgi:S1-C subfamily serine protease